MSMERRLGLRFLRGVVWILSAQIYRKNWMFSLVGSEGFKISSKPAEIVISCKGQLMLMHQL